MKNELCDRLDAIKEVAQCGSRYAGTLFFSYLFPHYSLPICRNRRFPLSVPDVSRIDGVMPAVYIPNESQIFSRICALYVPSTVPIRPAESPAMVKKDDPATLAAIREMLEGDADLRAPIAQWMWANHDEFAKALRGKRPKWDDLTKTFSSLGFANANGEPLRPETVRKHWQRVRRSRAKDKENGGEGPEDRRLKRTESSLPRKPSAVIPLRLPHDATPSEPPSSAEQVPARPSGATKDLGENAQRELDRLTDALKRKSNQLPDPIY